MRTTLLAVLLLLIASSAAAGHRVPLDGETKGCGDAALFLVSADNGTVLTLDWPGAATGTWEPDEISKTLVGQVGADGIEVRLEVGRHLGQMVCNDAVENEPVVEQTYAGISGQVTMTLEAYQDFATGQDMPIARGRIDDLVLRADDGTVIRASDVVFDPVMVGWFAG